MRVWVSFNNVIMSNYDRIGHANLHTAVHIKKKSSKFQENSNSLTLIFNKGSPFQIFDILFC